MYMKSLRNIATIQQDAFIAQLVPTFELFPHIPIAKIIPHCYTSLVNPTLIPLYPTISKVECVLTV